MESFYNKKSTKTKVGNGKCNTVTDLSIMVFGRMQITLGLWTRKTINDINLCSKDYWTIQVGAHKAVVMMVM